MGNTAGNKTPITVLLRDWRNGDRQALDKLTPLVYDELRRIARGYLHAERPGHTLQSTALVHEAYVRLVDADVGWQDRAHFFAIAARTMRRILVDHAQARRTAKRGRGAIAITLHEDVVPHADTSGDADLLALDAALTKLAGLDQRHANIVELHYFGGLTYEEMAETLGLSTSTLDRDLRLAKAWLASELA
jgi:RNA polymerase sigma factor (TIGR02999 family)